MGARPGQWDLLGHGDDPIAGDPDSVDTESSHYGAVADEIRAQVARLRGLAAEPDLLGQYANTLRSSAGELASKLDKTAGRYQAVGNALRQWRPHLDNARADTARALADAEDAHSRVSANDNAPTPTPSQTEQTDAQQEAARQAEHLRTTALHNAQSDLSAARKRCADAVHERDRQAKIIKNAIKDAIDDDVHDSMWDNVKDFVDKHKELISQITEVLSWVATALAVVALFIPGLNIIALLAIGFTAATLMGHATLAATGNGSWFDVALDVFALVTLGTGRIAAKGIEGAAATTRAVAAKAARTEARSAARAGTRAQREALGRAAGRGTPAQRQAARAQIAALKKQATRTGTQAAQAVKSAPLPATTVLERLAAGGEDTAAATRKMVQGWATQFPGKVDAAAKGLNKPLAVTRGAFGAGAVSDLGDKILGDSSIWPGKPSLPSYGNLKDKFHWEWGSTW